MTNNDKTKAARRRLGMSRKPTKPSGRIVQYSEMLFELTDVCWAAGLSEMAQTVERLGDDVRLYHRAELMDAEELWT